MGFGERERMLGVGVYTLQEAALYGRISSRKLSRWAFGAGHSPGQSHSQVSWVISLRR